LPGLNLGQSFEGSARDLQVYGLGALTATIRLRVEAHFLVFRETGQARRLYGRDVDEDIGAAIIWLDEAEALVGIEEFYSASFGHAAGPFLSVRVQRRTAQQYCPKGRRQAVLRKGPCCYRGEWQEKVFQIAPSSAARSFGAFGSHHYRSSHARKLPEPEQIAVFKLNWQEKVLRICAVELKIRSARTRW
jgi:hypothetical protein